MYVRSPSAYEALKSFNILQLPSHTSLQSYTGAFLHEAGASLDTIVKQTEIYRAYICTCEREGKSVPQSDGVLIFDEVKVITGLIWNSRNQSIIGLAMSEKDQASLHDVFQTINPDNHIQQTDHILQFLWRDLTSSFDVIGPYFSSNETMSTKFVMACVFEAIKLFQVWYNCNYCARDTC